MFDKFDQLMLLALGKVIYFNNANKSIGYFSKIGYKCPIHSNPADYFMEVMSIESYEIDDENPENLTRKRSEAEDKFHSKIENFNKFYENSELKCNVEDKHPEAINISEQNIENYTASFILQFFLLTQRATRNNMRLKLTSYVKIFSAIITAIIILLIFGYLGKDDQSIMNRNGVLFLMVMQFIFNPVQGGIHIFPDETPVFMREYSNGMYSSLVYFICRSLNDMPGIIVYNTLLSVIQSKNVKLIHDKSSNQSS